MIVLSLVRLSSISMRILVLCHCCMWRLGCQLVEVWAKEARRLSSLPEETGDGDGKSEDNRQALGILNTRITDDLGKSDTS